MKEKFVIEDFIIIYKGTTNFCDTPYFKAFYDSLDDEKLYSHIIFNNDILKIPPILTFVKYEIIDMYFVLAHGKNHPVGLVLALHFYQFAQFLILRGFKK